MLKIESAACPESQVVELIEILTRNFTDYGRKYQQLITLNWKKEEIKANMSIRVYRPNASVNPQIHISDGGMLCGALGK